MSLQQILDNDAPTLERQFKGHMGPVTALSFHPDSTKLVSSSTDTRLMLWSLKKSARALSIENHSDSVLDVYYSPKGNVFASCSKDRSVRLWKPAVKLSCKQFRAHTSAVCSVHISPSSDTLLTSSKDKSIKMWTVDHNNKFLSTFHGHTHWVNCARFSPNETLVASCSEDKSVKLWDRNSNLCIHTFQGLEGIPKNVEWHPNSKCIGVGYSNKEIKIFDIRSPHNLLQYYAFHSDSVNQVAFHQSGRFMMSASSDKTAKVFDLLEGRALYTLEGHEGPVTTVCFSSDGHFFATGGADKMILVWQSNFDKEVLAMPLVSEETVSLSEGIIHRVPKPHCCEKETKHVDGRKSFAVMVQPEVEVSLVCTSSSSLSDEEKNPANVPSDNSLSSHTSDRDCASSSSNEMPTDVKSFLQELKMQVNSIQNQLEGISTRLSSLEDKADK